MTALLLLAQLCALDSQYLSAVNVADLRYAARDYPAALEYYTRARDLLPGDPGPGTVIGWILYKMGRFVEAESVFDEVLATYPEHERALEGRALVPRPYRLGLTGAVTGDFGTRLTWFGFVEYNRRFVTTITFGFQGVKRDSGWSGFTTGLVVYHRLRYPWSARLDLYTLSALTDPRYWRMVYAPSVTRVVLGMPARLTFIGWDRLGTAGLEAWTEREVGAHFLVSGAPVFNADSGRAGWFVPVSVQRRMREGLSVRVMAGLGSIRDHVDIAVPILYNQPQRLRATVRVGTNASVASRYRLVLFGAWERYSDRTNRLFVSLTLSARL